VIGASQFRAAPVAAGSLPVGNGGIHASRTKRASGDVNELFMAWQEFTVSPAGLEARLYVSRMADATVASHRVSCDRKKLRVALW